MQKIKLNIAGMSCVNCSNAVERVANKIEGVTYAKVSFANGVGEFEVTDESILEILKSKIKKLGYEIVFNADEFEKKQKEHILRLRNSFIMAMILATLAMIFEMHFKQTLFINLLTILISSFVIFYNGKSFFTHAYASMRSKNYDMNVLVALGASSAFLHSVFVVIFREILPENLTQLYVSGGAMIISFVLLGKFLEERSKARAGDYLKTLMDMSPKTALIIKPDGQNKQISVDELKIGDIVVVKNGYNIPSDGIIIQGGAEIDTSALTGESLPSYKQIGDEVFAGTSNVNGYISVRITKLPTNTLLSQILALLSDASTKKMPISRLADRVANIFVPSVIILSVLTLIVWLVFSQNMTYAISAAICVLIISCPCALGLATPIAIISALSRGAKGGILIKNPEVLEIIKDIKFAIFDKTGTLSKGEISVFECSLSSENLELIAGVEKLSEHPISKAITKYANKNGIRTARLNGEFKNLVGLGVVYKDEKYEIVIGNERLFDKFNIKRCEILAKNDQKGVVLCAINKEFVGYISIADELRSETKELLDELKLQGITPVILSGDDISVVSSVATQIGIDKFYANAMPNDKLNILKELQNSGRVLFVGDGINDSLCLKQADVGMAMNSGSDIAKGAGDIVLIKNNLNSVSLALNLGKKTMRTIKQNLFWAFIYNLICIPIAAGVLYPMFGLLLSPMYAALAMCFSSVNVVLNSIRLRFAKI